MINHLSITNNGIIPKPQEIEQKNIVPQWNGKKVYAAYNSRSVWISRIACVIFIALGIALIAALATPGALAFGIAMIALTSIGWLTSECIFIKSVNDEEKKRREGKNSFCQGFGCRPNYSDLPEVKWELDKKTVTICLTQREINTHPKQGIVKGLIPECADPKKHPFIITLFPDDENKLDPVVFVYDNKLKKNTFKFTLDGQSIFLKEYPLDPRDLPKIRKELRFI